MKRKKSLGQTTVEFALTLPAMLMFIMGIMDLGRFLFYNSTLTNAVREGARYGIVQTHYDESILADIAQKVIDHAVAMKPEDLTVTVSFIEADPTFPDRPIVDSIFVVSTYDFYPATPIGVLILGSGDAITMYAEATMSVEN
jgi:Flp pilus assembly protein TadG